MVAPFGRTRRAPSGPFITTSVTFPKDPFVVAVSWGARPIVRRVRGLQTRAGPRPTPGQTILDLASTRAATVESDLFSAASPRVSIEQFGIVRRLHAFEISWPSGEGRRKCRDQRFRVR